MSTHTSLWILFVIILFASAVVHQKVKEGFYFNFFQPLPCNPASKDIRTTVLPNTANVLFQFPPNTSKAEMLRHVLHLFKKKANLAFTNVISVKTKKTPQGAVYLNVQITKPQHISQVSARLVVPLEFVAQGVVAKVDKRTVTPEIDYFLHYFFDPFYCQGKHETPLLHPNEIVLKHHDDNDNNNNNINNNTRPYDLIINTKVCPPSPLSIEPDSDARVRKYATPATTALTTTAAAPFNKTWDARGVTMDKTQQNVTYTQFINHPALYQGRTDGLYDDMFDLSRLIPSFPSGKASGGR